MSGSVSDDPVLPLALARQVDEVCCRFEAAWRAAGPDGPPRPEAFLAGLSAPVHPALLRELLKVEAHYRRLAGDAPRPEHYLDRFPGLTAADLAGVFTARGETHPVREHRDASLAALIDALGRSRLLDPDQERAARERAGAVERASELTEWLVARGWLTGYQARQLLSGSPGDLALGDYRVLEPLGAGGMGWVFKARHVLMNRVVAIKRIRPEAVRDPVAVRRFRTEVRAAAQLNHPNVVTVHDAEEVPGGLFLVMELCEGVTLGDLVAQRGPLPVHEACEYARQACSGLQHAFERGLVHRDLKPDNLMLCGATVKILDFGLARLGAESGPDAPTREGMIVGTPDYMAPEQIEGRCDVRSDLYSLGCTLYFLLTGRPPFPGGSPLGKCLRHQTEEPEPLARLRPGVPRPLQEVVGRLMAKRPDDRFQTPAEAAAALDGVTSSGRSPNGPGADVAPAPAGHARARRTGLILGLAALLTASGLVAWAALRHAVNPDPPDGPVATDPAGEPPVSVKAWRPSRALPQPPKTKAPQCYGLAFSPDGRLLAAVFGNNEDSSPEQPGRLCVWELGRGPQPIWDREVGSGTGTCVAFSPDGAHLAWGSCTLREGKTFPGHVTIWDVARAQEVRQFEAHPGGVLRLAFQPRGNLLVTTGHEGTVRAWDQKSWTLQFKLADFHTPVYGLAFAPDGRRLAVGSDDGSVELWNPGTRQRVATASQGTRKEIRGLAFAPDGETILAATKAGEERVAELLGWQGRDPLSHAPLGKAHSTCLAVTPDRATALVGFADGTAVLIETATRRNLQALTNEHGRAFLCAAFSPDGQLLATSGGWGAPVQLWQPR